MEANEKQITIAVVDYCKAMNIPVMHYAAERKCSYAYGKMLKKMGTIAGVSDLFIFQPTPKFAGLWLELKIPGKKPTELQYQFIERVKNLGYAATWTDSVDTAINIIDQYMSEK